MSNDYRICKRCVMDTSDHEIEFDSEGVCNHCHEFDELAERIWFRGDEGIRLLNERISRIKHEGRGKEFDCILGLSGGVDSSFLALKTHEWGLRPLVVHVDTGWNSELAVSNIEKIVNHCNYELHTHVMNWEEMRDLQLAYFKAAVSNQDVPQDHAIFASIYHFAVKNNITTILSGGNFATEAVLPQSWLGTAMDAMNLHDIYRQYGSGSLKQFKTISFFEYYIWYPFVRKIKTFRPLNYITYEKNDAIQYLKDTIGWKEYDRKHGESVFTKFYQNYYLPKKFGYDKRRAHYSSMILSGQMKRMEALELLENPLYEAKELENDIAYICKKLRVSRKEFEDLLNAPPHGYLDFKNWNKKYAVIKSLQKVFARVSSKHVHIYS